VETISEREEGMSKYKSVCPQCGHQIDWIKRKKPTHGASESTGSLLSRQVANGYKRFLARHGMKAPGKWKSGDLANKNSHAARRGTVRDPLASAYG